MNCDPIGIGDGVNVYAYCRNNPVGNVGSSGAQIRSGLMLSVSTAQYVTTSNNKLKNINFSTLSLDKNDSIAPSSKLLSTGTNNINFSTPTYNKPDPKSILEKVRDIASSNSLLADQYKSKTLLLFKSVFTDPLPKKFLDLYSYGGDKPYILSENEMKQLHPVGTGIQGFSKLDTDKYMPIIASVKRGETIDFTSMVATGANTAGTLNRFWVHFQGKLTKFEDDSWSFEGTMYFKDIYDFITTPTPEDGIPRLEWGDQQTRIGKEVLIGGPFTVFSAVVNVTD